MKQGPIVIVDDDEDDILILKEIFADLGVRNKVQWFATCPAAFEVMMTLSPWMSTRKATT